MSAPLITVLVRDVNGDIVDEIEDFVKIDVIRRFRDVSSWSIEAPLTDASLALSQPGAAIVIQRVGTLISGPMQVTERSWAHDVDNLILSGVSDDSLLWDRIVYPASPSGTSGTVFSAAAYDALTDVAETVMKHFVEANCSVTGFDGTDRVVPGLVMGPDLGRGLSVVGSGRFQSVGQMCQDLAIAGGVGFDVVDLVFDVYVPVDRTDDILFSQEIGNLYGFDYSNTAPTATHFVIAGGGEDVARTFLLGGDDAAAATWNRRIELFVDRRDTTDSTQLAQELATRQADNAAKTVLELKPVDVDGMTYGVDYNLGDLATATTDGSSIQGVIAQVELALDDTGETVVPTVSSQTAQAAVDVLKAFTEIRKLKRAVSSLERNL